MAMREALDVRREIALPFGPCSDMTALRGEVKDAVERSSVQLIVVGQEELVDLVIANFFM